LSFHPWNVTITRDFTEQDVIVETNGASENRFSAAYAMLPEHI